MSFYDWKSNNQITLVRLPTSQTIPALGSIISSVSPTPLPHVRKACTSLLTKQLLRPDGVQGLCIAFFSEEDHTGDMAQLDKLEQFARILNSVPFALKAEVNFTLISDH